MPNGPEEATRLPVNGGDIAAAIHHAAGKQIVIFCHGFRGTKIGPHRSFVLLARQLQQDGIASLRFDQLGSGDSDGDFVDSSFDQWIDTITQVAKWYLAEGYQVALLGQSMGGSAAIAAAAALGNRLTSLVAWVPDASVDTLVEVGEFNEEGGERVDWGFWREAHDADIPRRFSEIRVPTLVFFATEDAYVSPENQRAIVDVAQPHQEFVWLYDHSHSSWTYDQTAAVLTRSREFLVARFGETWLS